MQVNQKLPTFKEFYYLEEGMGDIISEKKQQILNKWQDIKFHLRHDEEGTPINTKKVHSLKDEIFLLLTRLKQESEEIAKEVLNKIIQDFGLNLRNNKVQNFFRIAIWLLHLIAILGLYKFNEMKAARRIMDGTATQAEYQTLEKQKTSNIKTNHP